MELLLTIGAAIVVGVLVLLALRVRARRAALRRFVADHGWASARDGEATVVTPSDGAWSVRMTRSFATQQTVKTQIVVSTWTSGTPRAISGAVVVGPSPPEPMRTLAVNLIGSLDPKMSGWLGLARVGDGAPLRHLPSVDHRLLALATDSAGPVGALTEVANAVANWCTEHRSEREQPAVTFGTDGVTVRVRIDVLRSTDQLAAFVDLGKRCAAALDGVAR